MPSDNTWGVAGLSVSDGVSLQVLDPCDDERNWLLEMWFGPLEIVVVIDGPEKITHIKEFISETLNNPKYRDKQISPSTFQQMDTVDMVVGHFEEHAVLLLKDGEFGDRYFIYCGDETGDARLRFTLGDEFLESFVTAISALATDLEQ